jgi:hypothetical protein
MGGREEAAGFDELAVTDVVDEVVGLDVAEALLELAAEALEDELE